MKNAHLEPFIRADTLIRGSCDRVRAQRYLAEAIFPSVCSWTVKKGWMKWYLLNQLAYQAFQSLCFSLRGNVSLIWDLCLSSNYWMLQLDGTVCHLIINKDSGAVSGNKVTPKSWPLKYQFSKKTKQTKRLVSFFCCCMSYFSLKWFAVLLKLSYKVKICPCLYITVSHTVS